MKNKVIAGIVAVSAGVGLFVAGVERFAARQKVKNRGHKENLDRGGTDGDEDPDDRPNKQKNALIVTSVASMVDQFIMPSIELLIELGYDVDVATNFIKGSTCSDEKIRELMRRLDDMSVDCYHIDFDRKILNARAEIKSFQQLDAVMLGSAEPVNKTRHHRNNTGVGYTLVHSHSPIGGVVGRIEARKHGIRSIYTAHGFHFYDGAPLKNWLLFYPIEWFLSFITDTLITINKEDYHRASKHLHAKETAYIPGIGIDVERFRDVKVDRDKKRAELGIGKNDVMLLSVGELNENKNHRVVVEALGMMDDCSHLHYFIAGKDAGQGDALVKLAQRKSVYLHLLGFRTDIPELLKVADVFLLPSIREGLNVGVMEAMAVGLPCIVSDIRGNRDLIDDKGGCRCTPINSSEWSHDIKTISNHTVSDFGLYNQKKIVKFNLEAVNERLKSLYAEKCIKEFFIS